MQQMLTNLRARREDERGFTLIELMVVVLIIAILIAIAIPTFLGAKTRAQDKAAQSSLRNALTNAKGIYTDTDSYLTSTAAALQLAEPSLSFKATGVASAAAKEVSVNPLSASTELFVAMSSSGVCWVIGDNAQGPGTAFAKITGACTGTNANTKLGVLDATTQPAAGTNTSATADAWVAAF